MNEHVKRLYPSGRPRMILQIPEDFMTIPYKGCVTPENAQSSTLSEGCNCQVFAYAVLQHFGLELPPFRSSELWEDLLYTFSVTSFKPLDLMLYNNEDRPWGAHVGIYIGDQQVLHLSKEVGKPVVEPHYSFASKSNYAFFIGAKRVRITTA